MSAQARAWAGLALLLTVVAQVVDEAIAELLNADELEQGVADRLVRITDAARELGEALTDLAAEATA